MMIFVMNCNIFRVFIGSFIYLWNNYTLQILVNGIHFEIRKQYDEIVSSLFSASILRSSPSDRSAIDIQDGE